MESVRDALDLLLRHEALSERQHRKLVRAVEHLERPPAAPASWTQRIAAAFRRPPESDLLGLRLLRGDLSEAAFSARLKIECIVVSSCWGFTMLVWFAVLRFWDDQASFSLKQLRESAFVLIAGATLMGILFYLLFALPMGLWWSRRRRRLDELQAQREAGGDV